MARRKGSDQEPSRQQRNEIDERRASEEGADPKELREINEARGDGGNPSWWKNDGGSGELQ